MKLKQNFVIRKVADVWVAMSLGVEVVSFHGMLTLNETGALLWKSLEQGSDIEVMADLLVKEYDVSREQALADVREFCEKLVDCGCAEL